jgi:ADP-ribose pyrophosphatase
MDTLGERVLHSSRWVDLKERTFRDRSGRERSWVFAERPGERPAVVIVARTAVTGSLIAVEQYRVPFQRPVLEFPAGLLDAGEQPAGAALRELAEETGYSGEVLAVGPPVSTTAGLATETVQMVYVRCGEEPSGAAAPDEAESIRVLKIPPADFPAVLRRFAAEGRLLDAKLYVYLKEAAC